MALLSNTSGIPSILAGSVTCDAPEMWGTNMQDPASGWMYAIIDLNDRILFYLALLTVLVGWFLVRALAASPARDLPYRHESHGNILELGWTVSPALILWVIALPSLRLLYLMDETVDPELTVRAVGHQWYWSYEYGDVTGSDGEPLAFDSFLVGDDSLSPGERRMLEVDSPLVLPVGAGVRLLVSGADVIHSFAVPSLGVKIDAIPGRLNGAGLLVTRPGTFYGQCSELCGFLHGMMPITLRAVHLPAYLTYLDSLTGLYSRDHSLHSFGEGGLRTTQ
jgi:cytochrome c oxidase subunit 2